MPITPILKLCTRSPKIFKIFSKKRWACTIKQSRVRKHCKLNLPFHHKAIQAFKSKSKLRYPTKYLICMNFQPLFFLKKSQRKTSTLRLFSLTFSENKMVVFEMIGLAKLSVYCLLWNDWKETKKLKKGLSNGKLNNSRFSSL